MIEGLVVRCSVGSSCVGRQGQGLVARFTLFHTRIKCLTRSSGFQKLENSNLEILKFEARFAYRK